MFGLCDSREGSQPNKSLRLMVETMTVDFTVQLDGINAPYIQVDSMICNSRLYERHCQSN